MSLLDRLVVAAAATDAALNAMEVISDTLKEAPLEKGAEQLAALMSAVMIVMCEAAKLANEGSGKPHREVIAKLAEQAMNHFPEPKVEVADLPSTGKSARGPSPWGNVR